MIFERTLIYSLYSPYSIYSRMAIHGALGLEYESSYGLIFEAAVEEGPDFQASWNSQTDALHSITLSSP